MTVFIAHAAADMDAAELLAKAIERRGLFVEHESGEHVGRDLLEKDALVLIWSAAMAGDQNHLVVERRALDAWAEGRLILVALDGAAAPLGLRDLPTVIASPGDWTSLQEQTVAAIDEALQTEPPTKAALPPPARMTTPAPQARAKKPAKAKSKPKRKSKGGGFGVLFVLIAVLALIGLAAFVFDRIRYAVFDITDVSELAAPGAGVLVSLVLLVWLFRKGFAPAPKAGRKPEAEAEDDGPVTPTGGPVFVSYARDDAVAVGPVVAAVERAGRPVWIDKSDIRAGIGWAGEIVRAIRGAEGVMVVCSPAAFRSDHVKREVYLADRYQKPLLPVMLAPAPMPEDFEYFFAGVQWLDLSALAETERREAIKQALSSR